MYQECYCQEFAKQYNEIISRFFVVFAVSGNRKLFHKSTRHFYIAATVKTRFNLASTMTGSTQI